jgi:hypothetical protein
MSKNTNKSEFRKIDIDALDPENFELDDDDDSQSNRPEDLGPNESEVSALLNTKQNVKALNLVLTHAPLNTKDQKIKV